MQKIVIAIVTVMPMLMQAQVISLENTYRQNDRLTGRQMEVPQFSTNGDSLVWNLGDWGEISEADYVVDYENAGDENEELTAVTEQDTRYLYGMQGDSLLIRGFENHVSRMDYDLPEAYLRFPMAYGDSIEGYFHGKGKYCDRLAVRHYGRYKTKAEGMGVFVTDEGDTLRNVVCLHTERIMTAEQTDIALLDSLPVYNTDSIENHLAADSTLIRVDVYRWYAEGYRYPLVETRIRHDAGQEEALTAAAYYFPPSALATISNDPDNEEVRARIRQGMLWSVVADKTGGKAVDNENSIPVSESAGESGEGPLGYGLYGISGRRVSESQKVRNGVYLREQHQGDDRTAKKVTIKK